MFAEEEIFSSSNKITRSACELIRKYQSGELLPARTGYDYLDRACMGGLYPQNVIAIGGRSGTGKSFFLQKVMDSVMDVRINPQAKDYMYIRCEFEMNPMDLIVRMIADRLGKTVEDVLTKKQTASEEAVAQNIINKFDDPRIVYVPFPVTADKLCSELERRTLPQLSSKRLIIVSVDHIALVKKSGKDLKTSIDDFLARINELKLKFENVVFLLNSQFNRNIESRVTDPRMHAPMKSDFYASDELGQLASVMVGLHNPYDLGIDKYMSFSEKRYPWLDRFKTDTKKSFHTRGLIFHHVLKIRQGDIDRFEGIHVDVKLGFDKVYREQGTVTMVGKVDDTPKAPAQYILKEEELKNEKEERPDAPELF